MLIQDALRDFAADLRVDKSPKTILTYTEATGLFARFAGQVDLAEVTSRQVGDWLISLREAGRTEATQYNRYNGLRAFFRWAKDEGLVDESPIDKVPAPKTPAKPIPMLSIEQLKAMLKAADGRGFEQLRDTAIIRLMVDTGMRRQECAGLMIEDLDFDQDIAVVTGKGNRVRACPFGPRTAKALRRYLRARTEHEYGREPQLWLGRRGPLNPNALLLVLRRRARQAGITDRVFAHQLRHTWAHEALRSGLQEGDVMRLGGWRSREMLSRYGAAGADERARHNYRPVSLGDKL